MHSSLGWKLIYFVLSSRDKWFRVIDLASAINSGGVRQIIIIVAVTFVFSESWSKIRSGHVRFQPFFFLIFAISIPDTFWCISRGYRLRSGEGPTIRQKTHLAAKNFSHSNLSPLNRLSYSGIQSNWIFSQLRLVLFDIPKFYGTVIKSDNNKLN